MPKSKPLDELNRLYSQSESVDKEVFAEMRSNLLLVSGDHYSKATRERTERPNTTSAAQAAAKIRLVKNHVYRVSRNYRNAILEESPAVSIRPQIETDLQDQKDAELNKAVWTDISTKHKISRKTLDWAKDFVDIGEVCTKIFWDPPAGEFKGFAPKIDEETGEPLLEETGEMEISTDPLTGLETMVPLMREVENPEDPIFSGDFVFESIYGFNLLRESSVQSMHERGRAWIVRKMVDTKELQHRYRKEEAKLKGIQAGADETFVVFNGNRGSYEKAEGQTLLKEFYWPPCVEYPRGWYTFATNSVILEEGELPEGIWPFVWEGFDQFQTTPRGRSIIKVARPYQYEVNRASSKTAEAQVTLGDDKILYQVGTKLQQGALMSGVRGISYQGQTPTILGGRDGSQYQGYIKDQIVEMEQATMMYELAGPKEGGPVDPYALLFAAASKKKSYNEYLKKFEDFLVGVADLTLRLAKVYMPDDALIPAIGSREVVNIAEFRKTSALRHQIVIEPGTETLSTQLGKQLTFQHIVQYIGKDIDKATLGRILQNLPFGNFKDSFEDMTIDLDVAKNDMLALERGEKVEPTPYVEPSFMLKKLTARMKTPEYRFFQPEIQTAYEALKQGYQQLEVEQQEKILAAKNEFIPVDGALVGVDMYVQDPTDPTKKSNRARLPQRAVEWLIKQLEAQGMSLDKLEGMNSTSLAQMAEMMIGSQGQAQQMPGAA